MRVKTLWKVPAPATSTIGDATTLSSYSRLMDTIHDRQDADELSALRRLYPGLSARELLEARDNLAKYVDIVLLIYERIKDDPAAYAEFKRLIAERKRLIEEEAQMLQD